MPKARSGVAILLVLFAVTGGLGAWSARAIRHTARRRDALVDGLRASVPAIDGARILVPWQPVADADLVHTAMCFDDADAVGVLAKVAEALGRNGWRVSSSAGGRGGAGGHGGPGGGSHQRPAVLAANDVYRLRATIEPARRVDCDGTRDQVMLSIEAAPRLMRDGN